MIKLVILTVGVGLVMGVLLVAWGKSTETSVRVRPIQPTITLMPTPTFEPVRSVSLDVPFTSQSPFGEWGDSRQQDGCEEASVLMVYCALQKDKCKINEGKIESNWAKEKILDIHDFEVKNWDSGVDTSTKDTVSRIAEAYFGMDNARVVTVLSFEQIVRELMKGNIVVIPADGKKLENPNFTDGGPERHNLVISGYDSEMGEFITQDPGTRQGRNYRYEQELLFSAIRDYPTGVHQEILTDEKRMIVFEPGVIF